MAVHKNRSPLGDEALLREAQVCEALCISRATLRRLIAKGLFPASFKITPRVPVWRLSAVRAYIQSQSSAAQAPPVSEPPLPPLPSLPLRNRGR